MSKDEKGEDQIKAVSFAAGMAACMACIERAIVVSVFVHWRVWAFLALNLLLLAILFTSKFQSSPFDQESVCDSDSDEKKKKKTGQECERQVLTDGGGGETVKLPKCDEPVGEDEMMSEVEDDGKKEDYDELSKEELNQRVEAFIAMFRQHLVYDAKGKSYDGLDNMTSNQVVYHQPPSFSQSNKCIVK